MTWLTIRLLPAEQSRLDELIEQAARAGCVSLPSNGSRVCFHGTNGCPNGIGFLPPKRVPGET